MSRPTRRSSSVTVMTAAGLAGTAPIVDEVCYARPLRKGGEQDGSFVTFSSAVKSQ